MRIAHFLILTLCVLLVGAVNAQSTVTDRERLVGALMEAYNKQDPEGMALLVATDVQWLNINGSKITADASSRDELRKGMTDYFKSCPTCRSRFAGMVSTPRRVTAIEVAEWQKDGVKKTQRSISVYEFSGNLVSRVYYFPAEP